jgi:hypothetical protein
VTLTLVSRVVSLLGKPVLLSVRVHACDLCMCLGLRFSGAEMAPLGTSESLGRIQIEWLGSDTGTIRDSLIDPVDANDIVDQPPGAPDFNAM